MLPSKNLFGCFFQRCFRYCAAFFSEHVKPPTKGALSRKSLIQKHHHKAEVRANIISALVFPASKYFENNRIGTWTLKKKKPRYCSPRVYLYLNTEKNPGFFNVWDVTF